MLVILSRLVIAVVFLIVELVLATAFVAQFSKPVEYLKAWFGGHRRTTFAVILPLLFVTNVGLTFLFSLPGSNGYAGHEETRSDDPVHELPRAAEIFESFPEQERREETAPPAPIPGYPADRTMGSIEELVLPALLKDFGRPASESLDAR